jgi:hypothetical protein
MYKDFFSVNGIPQSLVVSLSVLLFLVSVAPLFSGSKVFGVDFPNLSRLGRRVAPVVGSLGLLLVVLGFQSRWIDRNEQSERLPFCSLENDDPTASKQSFRWFTDSSFPAWSVVKVDNNVISREAKGSQEIYKDQGDNLAVVEVAAGNRYGTCQKKILVVWKNPSDASAPNDCSLAIDRDQAAIGDTYKLTWRVSGPQGTVAYINGQRVALSDSANFTFTGPNYDRFHLRGNSGGVECEDQAWVRLK